MENTHNMEHTLYLVLHRDFGWSPYSSIHATEEGAHARRAQLGAEGIGGMHVLRYHFGEGVMVGMQVRVSTSTSPYDEDYLDVWVRNASEDGDGALKEVMA